MGQYAILSPILEFQTLHLSQVFEVVSRRSSGIPKAVKFTQKRPRTKFMKQEYKGIGGRGCSRKHVSDSTLREALRPYCRESRKWSVSAGVPMLLLNYELRDLWMRAPELHKIICYQSLSKRLRRARPRLGVARWCQESDLCSICYTWDRSVKQECITLVKNSLRQLRSEIATYWTPFVEKSRERGWDTKFAPVDSMDFWDELILHLKRWPAPSRDKVLKDVQSMRQDVKHFANHWRMRDHSYTILRKDWTSPAANSLYMWSDWMVWALAP